MTDAPGPTPGPRLDWGAGQYETTALELEPVAARVIEMAGIVPGERALDVACGTGNAALLAARAGASVTGLDASERLLSVAATRAAAENIDAHWETGDLHELPFADGSFELVISIFGVIFARDPKRAISEIVRVLVPGGRALVTIWIPRGGLDAVAGIAMRGVFAALGQASPQRFPWADQAAVSGIVAQAGGQVSFAEGQLVFTGLSPEAYYDEVQSVHPMSVSARPLLEQAGTYDDVRAQMIDALAAYNEDPSGLRLTSPYLIAEIRPLGAG
jgi:SAM-dependent methyltransferase